MTAATTWQQLAAYFQVPPWNDLKQLINNTDERGDHN